jgi:hypothetical protein
MDMEIIVVPDRDEKPQKRRMSIAKYPHSKEVFSLWGNYPPFWNLNAAFCSAAEWLYTEKGIEELSDLIKWYAKHKDDPYCPQFHNPKDLAEKYGKLEAFYDKNHG